MFFKTKPMDLCLPKHKIIYYSFMLVLLMTD